MVKVVLARHHLHQTQLVETVKLALKMAQMVMHWLWLAVILGLSMELT
jgi:hypothetical protein